MGARRDKDRFLQGAGAIGGSYSFPLAPALNHRGFVDISLFCLTHRKLVKMFPSWVGDPSVVRDAPYSTELRMDGKSK